MSGKDKDVFASLMSMVSCFLNCILNFNYKQTYKQVLEFLAVGVIFVALGFEKEICMQKFEIGSLLVLNN